MDRLDDFEVWLKLCIVLSAARTINVTSRPALLPVVSASAGRLTGEQTLRKEYSDIPYRFNRDPAMQDVNVHSSTVARQQSDGYLMGPLAIARHIEVLATLTLTQRSSHSTPRAQEQRNERSEWTDRQF